MPTPYSPGSGRVNPQEAHSRSKNACGIWIRSPAPSPVTGSLPLAPRCCRLTRIWIPFRIMSCDGTPLMLAMNPRPQASRSNAGSYSPCFSGVPPLP